MPRLDVLCVGRACVDEILEVEDYPAEDTKVPALTRLREGGGQASTAACLISHLGGRAAFVGRTGDDEPGAFARQRMAAFGVNLSLLPPPRGVTPAATCLVARRNDSRTIVYEKLAADPLSWAELAPALAAAPRVVLVDPQAEALLPRLIEACRERAIPLVADTERAAPGWEQTWGQVDVLAASQGFLAQAVPGFAPAAALAEIDRHGPGWSCVTLGPLGCLVRIGGATHGLPAQEVAVRDTTGAGDAFHGALALALALARGSDPLAAGRCPLCNRRRQPELSGSGRAELSHRWRGGADRRPVLTAAPGDSRNAGGQGERAASARGGKTVTGWSTTPFRSPGARGIYTDHGFEEGNIVDGRGVLHLCGSV